MEAAFLLLKFFCHPDEGGSCLAFVQKMNRSLVPRDDSSIWVYFSSLLSSLH